MDNADIRNLILLHRQNLMFNEVNVAARKRRHMWFYFNRWKAWVAQGGNARSMIPLPVTLSEIWTESDVMDEIGVLMAEAFQRHLRQHHRN